MNQDEIINTDKGKNLKYESCSKYDFESKKDIINEKCFKECELEEPSTYTEYIQEFNDDGSLKYDSDCETNPKCKLVFTEKKITYTPPPCESFCKDCKFLVE